MTLISKRPYVHLLHILPLGLKSYLKKWPVCIPAFYFARQLPNTTVKRNTIIHTNSLGNKMQAGCDESRIKNPALRNLACAIYASLTATGTVENEVWNLSSRLVVTCKLSVLQWSPLGMGWYLAYCNKCLPTGDWNN